MKIYRVYTSVNAADTSRDIDDMHYTELGLFMEFCTAKNVADAYIKNRFFKKDSEIKECQDGIWRVVDSCSYGATLVILPLEVN